MGGGMTSSIYFFPGPPLKGPRVKLGIYNGVLTFKITFVERTINNRSANPVVFVKVIDGCESHCFRRNNCLKYQDDSVFDELRKHL